eukprot:s3203_g11.t1
MQDTIARLSGRKKGCRVRIEKAALYWQLWTALAWSSSAALCPGQSMPRALRSDIVRAAQISEINFAHTTERRYEQAELAFLVKSQHAYLQVCEKLECLQGLIWWC